MTDCFNLLSLAMHPIVHEDKEKVVLFPGRKRSGVSSPPTHRHDWYKSLARGSGAPARHGAASLPQQSNNCDSAAEHGRKYCLAHLTSKLQ